MKSTSRRYLQNSVPRYLSVDYDWLSFFIEFHQGLATCVIHIDRGTFLLIDDFNFEREHVADDTVVPLHTEEMASDVIEIILDRSFGKSPGQSLVAPDFFRGTTSPARQGCIDHLRTPPSNRNCLRRIIEVLCFAKPQIPVFQLDVVSPSTNYNKTQVNKFPRRSKLWPEAQTEWLICGVSHEGTFARIRLFESVCLNS
jgi:hypothetical protein